MADPWIPASIPDHPPVDPSVDRAPRLRNVLTASEERLALANALRYLPSSWHGQLAPEFLEELRRDGRIRMHRFRPHERIRAKPIEAYEARTVRGAAMMLMIDNNLDPDVAQYPYELITYGGNGSVFQNWMQYRRTMHYLSIMDDEQTLVMMSGHPAGLHPSSNRAPHAVITNGMMVPNHSSRSDFDRFNALGVTQYGQMTAGSWMYIGPQGIVHGTTLTLMNAARRYLGHEGSDLSGVTYVTSGLGGMSGAQARAATIAGASCIIAEVNPHAAAKRLDQGWLSVIHEDADDAIDRMLLSQSEGEGVSIGFVGNIVDLWSRLDARDVAVDLGSDQTSLHDPFGGGYLPQGYSLEDARTLMQTDPDRYVIEVQRTLVEHARLIGRMADRGMAFWDYGNAFLLEASRAGGDVLSEDGSFRYPSYVEHIMGPICFDHGFGPFRWVCASGTVEDLSRSDELAAEVLRSHLNDSPDSIKRQLEDNLRWIEHAMEHGLVVGSKARILYADERGRRDIALRFNEAIAAGYLSGPVILGRDHHDVSGTDSPYRETADIADGSRFSADMAVQNVIGDAARGATWVSLHNGGGVGWGEVINGGFGMVLDGTDASGESAAAMLSWDVTNGVARRAWARHEGALSTIDRIEAMRPGLVVTRPTTVDPNVLDEVMR